MNKKVEKDGPMREREKRVKMMRSSGIDPISWVNNEDQANCK